MDTSPVNWDALDALIIDFAKSENLIDDTSSPSSASLTSPSISSSSYHSRLIIRQIRRSLEAGNIDAAIDLLRAHAPFVLEDHRLLFRLQKQKFIEFLRKGTTEDRGFAIDYMRKSLAPCALNAYPVDIQALAQAVELTRQGAIDSLRFAKGDLLQAFQNEICRMRLDAAMLDELVREYCIYRGIVESGVQTLSEPLKLNPPESGCCSSRDCSFDVDYNSAKCSNSETSVITDLSSTQGTDVELRYAAEPANNLEDCSTSGSHQSENSRLLRNRSHESGERSKRKRWRGRPDELDLISDVHFNRYSKQEISTAMQVASTTISNIQQGVENTNGEDKFETVLGMKELASRGMAAEVVEEINALDPNFFVQNPVLLFQLKQIEFLKLVELGDHSGALRVACSHLGALASSDPSLLKPLKETLLSLLRPNEDALVTGFPLRALATSLQVAFGKRLGIEEPQLMRIMRATLHTHSEWFKLQMCKDPFESLLRIDFLKENNAPVLTSLATSKSNTDCCTLGSSQATVSSTTRVSDDGGSPNQASSRDVICDENAILKVMEFLALPRADAIHLLAQYNGNAETVIQQNEW
ncbi:uncharacterized protein LOC111317118 isoform X4 [Durio zibethinus]|uniref:Uncharacterized protein LOC111317118 isoform X4 n=1 Tax=Durio zibethinus TaxID=66656 RepID=A0A6P6BDL0_DURZI|nr:uncharacterized protein LOC111317118 isoform X4 [Durio zibethinus]